VTRIVATGLGVLASPGIGRGEFWKGLLAGGRGPSHVEGLGLRPGASDLAFQLPEFDTKKWIAPAAIRRLDRTGILAIVAAKLALEDARLGVPLHRVAIVIGAGGCGVTTTTGFHKRLVETAGTDPNPMAFPNTVPNAAAGQIAIATGITGFNTTLVQTGASGEEAIALAADLLAAGRCDAAVAGGIDELAAMMHYALHRLGGLSRTACRPFDRAADGAILAEDAGLVVLERLDDAKKRGARILAELAGCGRASSPARPLTYGPASAASTAIQSALARAGVAASDIAWVNSAANGAADARCAAAIRSVCAVSESTIPPTANLRDPAFELDLVREARPLKGAVVQHGAGTGGVDLAMVWRRHD
jgi:3-oxoacyl-[acyl-carrier-protein] synthase II